MSYINIRNNCYKLYVLLFQIEKTIYTIDYNTTTYIYIIILRIFNSIDKVHFLNSNATKNFAFCCCLYPFFYLLKFSSNFFPLNFNFRLDLV